MRYFLLLAVLLLAGCNQDCKDSEACEVFGQCINTDTPGRCVTGCERLCLDEGRCTPKNHGGKVECLATSRTACVDTNRCYFNGQCSPVNGRCLAASNADCKRSVNCRWEGRCSEVNAICLPVKPVDCSTSMGCAMWGKCHLSLSKHECLTSSEFNDEVNKLIDIMGIELRNEESN